MNNKLKREMRIIRHKRVRAKISGTSERPRFSVFRSNNHVFLQLIDDRSGKTLVSASSGEIKTAKSKAERAREASKLFTKRARAAGIEKVIFDRGGYKFHGRVKAVADIARESGLKI